MWSAVQSAFGDMLALIGQFLSALTNGALAPLLELFAIGITISLVMVAVKINWIFNPNGLQVGQLA